MSKFNIRDWIKGKVHISSVTLSEGVKIHDEAPKLGHRVLVNGTRKQAQWIADAINEKMERDGDTCQCGKQSNEDYRPCCSQECWSNRFEHQCDVCGRTPIVVIQNDRGTFCQEHADFKLESP